jgi:hypothetical protein
MRISPEIGRKRSSCIGTSQPAVPSPSLDLWSPLSQHYRPSFFNSKQETMANVR